MTLHGVLTLRRPSIARVHCIDGVLPGKYAGGYWTSRCGLFGHFTPSVSDGTDPQPACERCAGAALTHEQPPQPGTPRPQLVLFGAGYDPSSTRLSTPPRHKKGAKKR